MWWMWYCTVLFWRVKGPGRVAWSSRLAYPEVHYHVQEVNQVWQKASWQNGEYLFELKHTHPQKCTEDGLSRRNIKKKRKACEYRNRVRKGKAHLELKVSSDLKSKQEEFLYVRWQWKGGYRTCDPLFSGTGDLLTKDVEKAKGLNGFVTPIYNGTSCVPGGIV